MPEPVDGHTPTWGQMVRQRLAMLLDMLYAGPVSLDIVTLADIQRRYPLTGLGAPAIRAIEQAQRIVRAVGNYEQVGLCVFHIGLIYLHYDDFHGAVEQFAEARRQWSFVDNMASVCLAYFAEGQAQELALHQEAAMACYGKVVQWLPRVELSEARESLRRFTRALAEEVNLAQTALRDLLRQAWPDQTAAEGPQPKGTDSPDGNGRTVAPTPAASPITSGDVYHWYQVMSRAGDFLLDIPPQAWLLVDSSAKTFAHGALILIGSNSANLTGSIEVRPRIQRLPFHRIYVARLQEQTTPDEMPFVRNVETGEVRFRLPSDENQTTVILGSVVGYWLKSHP